MLVEGLNLQMKTSKKALQYFGWHYKHIEWLNYSIRWLLRFLIVVSSALVGFLTKTYMEKRNSNITNLTMFSSGTYEICWLDSESLMRVFACIIPISIMTSLNIISIICSVIVVCRMKRKDAEKYPNQGRHKTDNDLRLPQLGLKVILLLTLITGTTWIFLFWSSKWNLLSFIKYLVAYNLLIKYKNIEIF